MEHIDSIVKEFEWLQSILKNFSSSYERNGTLQPSWKEITPPEIQPNASSYGRLIADHQLSTEERLVLILGLMPHLRSDMLQYLLFENNRARLVKTRSNNVLPSGETALLLLAGDDIHKKIDYQRFFDTSHIFYRNSIVDIGPADDGSNLFDGVLKLNKTYRDLFVHNTFRKPRFSNEFPAHLLTSTFDWDDLIVNEHTRKKLNEIRAYHEFEALLKGDLGLKKHLKPGYRCLFYGPSGTGKTLAAALLGKYLNKDVYRVDLSSIVSKYIGETAKNLNNLFNTAEDKGWILFFDEGDALFGKRADTSQADNKSNYYANQDIGFLLQRIENYNGLVIVASNLRKNMDDAFSRRFQIIVHFDIPDAKNRLRLWQENVSAKLPFDSSVNVEQLSVKHHLSAATIVNVINRATLLTLSKKRQTIALAEIDQCILDEQYK
jgi:hypothetical protein